MKHTAMGWRQLRYNVALKWCEFTHRGHHEFYQRGPGYTFCHKCQKTHFRDLNPPVRSVTR
jgi:hypothetical protein